MLTSERDGYNHLYLYDLNGSLIKKAVGGQLIVKSFYGYDTADGSFYFSANPADDPMHTAVYRSDSKGKIEKLSAEEGDNSAIFSKNMKYYMNVYSNIRTPYVTTLCNRNGKTLKVLEDNQALVAKLDGQHLGTREFFQFTTGEGIQLNGYMVKPADFNPGKKYPVVMFQYSGPGSQQVLDSWGTGSMGGTLYEQYLAQQGFICVCVDGRGTGGRGAEFEKCTYLNLGYLEAKDQVETALYLGTLPYVDASRIGIWGWSYGGFNTLMSMSEGRPVFAAGSSRGSSYLLALLRHGLHGTLHAHPEGKCRRIRPRSDKPSRQVAWQAPDLPRHGRRQRPLPQLHGVCRSIGASRQTVHDAPL